MTPTQLQQDETRSNKLEPPRFEDAASKLVAGLRDHYATSTSNQIPALWQRFGPSIGRVPGQLSGATYGVCFPLSSGFDYMAAVEVSSASGLPESFSTSTIPAQRYAVFPHRDHVSKLYETCDAIEREWLPNSGHQLARGADGTPCFFERYGTSFNPFVGAGDVEVWVPIK
jgi:AraC family transcriptional regulator